MIIRAKILAVSIAAAALGGGMVDAAWANETIQDSGIGHKLILPYFTTQDGNATLINITNTDGLNGKAVKVRFRGAVDSDNIFDMQVFLSPGDVWTAAVTQGADGRSQLSTTDRSCTLPANPNQSFMTTRLAPYTHDGVVHDAIEQTREGYVEVINMADIPPYLDDPASAGYTMSANANPLYTEIRHSNGVPPCALTTLVNIEAAGGEVTSPIAGGLGATSYTGTQRLIAPTTGLMGHWVIINVPQTRTFAGAFTAIKATSQTMMVYSGQAGAGRVATHAAASPFTASPSLIANNIFPYLRLTEDGVLLNSAQTGIVTGDNDFPDLSTPYEPGVTLLPGTQAANLSQAMARQKVINEFLTDPVINAATDWVISMPTRRYHVSGRHPDYGAAGDGKGYPATESIDGIAGGVTAPFNNPVFASGGHGSCLYSGDTEYYNREESHGGFIVITQPPNAALCGGVSILSLNDAGASKSSVLSATVTAFNLSLGSVTVGWAIMQAGGIPILGSAFVKAYNPSASAGVSGNYGAVFPHSY